ncbi:hypothetical protein BC835DRAFT_1523871 [Cytidiella melzeri]|nr:hypothetical protein BC835DRAFT_1523871 [Cytidiella melzeri]
MVAYPHLSFPWPPSLLLLILTQLFVSAGAQAPTNWSTNPFNPPSLPLAVKNPYLNAWAPLAGGSAAINEAWPRSVLPLINILEWYGSIRVDGTAYTLLGAATVPNIPLAAQKSFTFTPTQTSYTLDCGGKVSVNMTFVTPIEATDLVRLSTPFSYLQVTATSSDGQPHSVQVYSDVSGGAIILYAWIAGDITQTSGWAIDDSDDFQFVSLQRQLTNPTLFAESFNRPNDGTVYYAAHKSNALTWQIGPSGDIRSSFANGTALNNAVETGESVVGAPSATNIIQGFAIDLGTIQSQSNSAVFALGIVRDPVIQYTNGQGQTQNRTAYYWSQFPNVNNVIADVLDHFPDALASASALDASIAHDAQTYGQDYANLLSLSTRQAMAALEYTLLKDPTTSSYNTSDVKAFMKDLGCTGTGVASDGSKPSSVNPVDVMYAAMPAYLYLNPSILGYLLNPLLEYQDSSQYSNAFAAQNLGGNYPNATGNSKAHSQGIEQSANMLIMCLAHAQTTGDGSLLSNHYGLLSTWANYLVNTALNPQQQTTSLSDSIGNDLAQLTNQTNLALKGIIGIAAMGKIAEAMNRSDDQAHFNSTAASYASTWKSLALPSGQPTDAFGSSDPGFLYNLYADALLGLDLIDQSVYDAHTALLKVEGFPIRNLAGPFEQHGPCRHVPFTTKCDIVLIESTYPYPSDWMLFAAATVTDSGVRSNMITQVARYNSQSLEGANQPFLVVYNPSTGAQGSVSQGSPAVGAMFAPLALRISKKTISSNNTSGGGGNGNGEGGGGGSGSGSGESDSKHVSTGLIAGVSIAGVVLIGGLAVLGMFLYRKRTTRRKRNSISLSIDLAPENQLLFSGIPNGSYDDMREFRPLAYTGMAAHGVNHDVITPFTTNTTSGTRSKSDDYLNGNLPAERAMSTSSSGPPMSVDPPTVAETTQSSASRSAGTPDVRPDDSISQVRSPLAKSSSSQPDSHILSEIGRIREEISRMRSAVEQGQVPPPRYYAEEGDLYPANASLVGQSDSNHS